MDKITTRPRLQVSFTYEELLALKALSDREGREPRWLIREIVVRELRKQGVLPKAVRLGGKTAAAADGAA